jgi:UDP-hydrolysing UDP-N-acetyl-D-glucosamine 2-epimerase
MTRKILFTVGSRANYGRLCSLITTFQNSSSFEVEIAVHSSAIVDKYGDISGVLKSNGHNPSYTIHTLLHSDEAEGLSKSLALAITEFATTLKQSKPDFVVVGGDRYEIMAPSIATMFHTAQLIHLQGGEVSGNVDDKVRSAVSKISDIHFPATREAYLRLLKDGASIDKTFSCGCPGMDVVMNVSSESIDFKELNEHGVGRILKNGSDFVMLIVHPESFDKEFNRQAMDIIFGALEKLELVENVIALWPNADLDNGAMSRTLRVILDEERYPSLNIKVYKGFAPEKFITLLSASKFCIGNSSSFVREGSIIGKPTVMIGNRQQDRDVKSNIKHADLSDDKSLRDTLNWAASIGDLKPDYSYGNGTSSKDIHDAILSLC